MEDTGHHPDTIGMLKCVEWTTQPNDFSLLPIPQPVPKTDHGPTEQVPEQHAPFFACCGGYGYRFSCLEPVEPLEGWTTATHQRIDTSFWRPLL